MVLTPHVTVYVHPINVQAHPTVPPGWRWAVVVGGRPPSDVEHTANAGWAPDQRSALLEGEQNAATAVRALRLLGVPATFSAQALDADPIPAGADRLHFVG